MPVYGREAVPHKLKNGLKTQKMHFLPVCPLQINKMKDYNLLPKCKPATLQTCLQTLQTCLRYCTHSIFRKKMMMVHSTLFNIPSSQTFPTLE